MTPLVPIALRNIGRKRQRSLLTGSIVAIGVVVLLFSKGYIAGLHQLMYEMIVEMNDGALEVEPEGYLASRDVAPLWLNLPSEGDLLEQVRATPGVRAVSPRLRFTGLLTSEATSSGFFGIAVDPALDRQVCPRGPAAGPRRDGSFVGLASGEGFQSSDEHSVVLA